MSEWLNRGIRLHKLVCESAKQRLLLNEVQPVLVRLHKETTQRNLDHILQNPGFVSTRTIFRWTVSRILDVVS